MKFVHQSLLVSIVLSCAWAYKVCCPPDKAVLLEEDICWEPRSNVTTPIVLECKNTVKLFMNFTVNEFDQLELQLGPEYVQKVEPDSYCLGNTTNMMDVSLSNTQAVTIICYEEEEPINDSRILGYCMAVSASFLAITTLIYTALPELRDTQGKSIINFCGCLAIGLGILAIMNLMTYSNMGLCAARGFLAYFFFIAAFFWSNAISIQILLNTRRPSVFDYSWKTFKWYMLYAWGCPILLTTSMAIVNFHPGRHQKPGIGLNHCWFFDKYLQWCYMYSVMSLLLAANIAIFIYTSIVLWRLSFSSSHIKALRYKFIMSVRLIIMMGLPWVFEMIGSLAPKHIIWAILDVFNTLQGILIFLLLVVFRRRVIKVMHKHHWLDCISGLVEKHLAVQDDEENVVQHTDVPMHDRVYIN